MALLPSYKNPPVNYAEVSGDVVSFISKYSLPLKSCIVSFPADANGISVINLERSGKNHFNPGNILKGTYDSSGEVWRNISGAVAKAVDCLFAKNTQYTFSGTAIESEANKNARLQIVYTDGSVDNLFATNSTDPLPFVKTSASGKTVDYLRYYFGTASNDGVSIENFQIEVGSTPSDYVNYIGDSYVINFGQPIFDGGTVDLRSGIVAPTGGASFLANPVIIETLGGLNIITTSGDGLVAQYIKIGG